MCQGKIAEIHYKLPFFLLCGPLCAFYKFIVSKKKSSVILSLPSSLCPVQSSRYQRISILFFALPKAKPKEKKFWDQDSMEKPNPSQSHTCEHSVKEQRAWRKHPLGSSHYVFMVVLLLHRLNLCTWALVPW